MQNPVSDWIFLPHGGQRRVAGDWRKPCWGWGTTSGRIERLTIDRALRRLCGFPLCKKRLSESTFSRAFDEFAAGKLAERVHEALIKAHLGETLIGHIGHDGTANVARERPARSAQSGKIAPDEKAATTGDEVKTEAATQTRPSPARRNENASQRIAPGAATPADAHSNARRYSHRV